MIMELKLISRAAIPTALAKAEKYRLLNEPDQAESICRDVLAIDPSDQRARVLLLLALTDQFRAQSTVGVRLAEEALAGIGDKFDRIYYGGLIRERWARALLAAGDPGHQAYVWMRDAMSAYEQAEPLSALGNDDAILRWNACLRTITREKLHDEHHDALGGSD
jgi:hypothetical protein